MTTNENGPVASRNEAASGHPISGQDTAFARAIEYAKRGWHVFPCEPNGKQPLGRLVPNGQDDATTDIEVVRDWWAQEPDANIGCALKPSDLSVIDPDQHADEVDGVAAWLDLAGEWPDTLTHRSPTGEGRHLFFKRIPGELRGKLAPGIDIKHNGYVLLPGSTIDGQPYVVERDVPVGSAPGWLAALARKPEPKPVPAGAPAAAPAALDHVRGLASKLGATPIGEGNDEAARTAAKVGGMVGAGQLDHETAAAILTAALAGWTYRDPADEATMHDTIRRQLVFGARSPRPWIEPPSGEGLGFAGPAPVAAPTSSWSPIDLTAVLDGTVAAVVPTIGKRADGVAILYPGKEHVVAGEPESGKTWFALSIVRDVLLSGGRVAYVDFEDDETTVVGRMLAFGMFRARFDPSVFRYVRPEAVPKGDELAELIDFPDGPADLVVFDGWTEGAGLLDLDIMNNGDMAVWRRMIIRPCLNAGAATLTTDHVVKDKEKRSRFSIGAGHKLAGLTGAMFIVQTTSTWGKGSKGRSRVLVSKDRNGGLRTNGKPTDEPNFTHFADLVGNAESGDMTSVVLYKPFDGDDSIRYTAKQRKAALRVLAYVESAPTPPLKTAIKSAVGGSGAELGNLIDRMKTEGFLAAVRQGRSEGYVLGDEKFDTEES